jgi:ribulose-5-phosphate 4-epimerase/fuculose-1-phosphate aldolase
MANGDDMGGLAFDAPALAPLKETLITGCHILDHEGVTDGFGHLSVRVPGAEAFLTLARVSPRLAAPERLVLLDFEGRRLGGAATSCTEWAIHARLLRARPEVQSVCHSHSRWSVLWSVLPTPLRPLHQLGSFLPAEGVPRYEAAGLIRSVAQGDALAAALGGAAAVLLRSHGDAVVGATVEETVQRAVWLAQAGELAHLAALHGTARYPTAEDLAAFEAGGRDARRGWDYYVSRLPQRG